MTNIKDTYNKVQLRNLKRASIKYYQERLKLALKKGESKETIKEIQQKIDKLQLELKKLK